MTSVIDARAAASALKRRAAHEERINRAPLGSRQREAQVLAWLKSELAHGGSLDEVVEFIKGMNARAGR